MKKYVKPMALSNNNLAEGVYMASGAEGSAPDEGDSARTGAAAAAAPRRTLRQLQHPGRRCRGGLRGV